MTKIKNFRVNLRPREIARWLKKERNLETTPDLETAVTAAIQEAKPWLSPAAVYTTLTRQTAEKMTTVPMPPEAVALSLVAYSIGPNLEAERQKAEPGSAREAVLAALAQEALAQSLHFAVRLIGEQAEEEERLMTPPVCVQEPSVASALANLLGVSRIGMQLDPNTSETPYARVATWFWTPAGKESARRAEPAGRAEKVTV